jgi:hypothetical protein
MQENLDSETIAIMPSYDANMQFIKGVKETLEPDYPSEPDSLADICIPPFQIDFVIHDSIYCIWK